MKGKTRKLLQVVAALVLIVGAGLVFFASRLDGIVAGLIEEQGSAATRTEVSVSGVSIDLRAASASLSGLSVASPEGFDEDTAIELGRFSVTLDPSTLTADTIVLTNVTVDGARLHLAQQGTRNNLRELLDNLRGDTDRAAADDSRAAAKKIVIDRFVLQDARAFVNLPDAGAEREVALPTITLNDVGRQSNGVTAAAATRQLLAPIIRRTLESAAVQSLKDRATEQLDEAKDSLLEGLQDRLAGDDESG